MDSKKLLSQAATFLKLAETPSLKKILKELSSMEVYKEKVDYAEKHLKHLSSGTSRVVYLLPGDKEVLKLSKNLRGTNQNLVEMSVKCKYVNKTTKADKKGSWKISPFLDKITETEFEEMTGINFKDFGACMKYELTDISGDKKSKKEPNNFENISKSDIFKQLCKTARKYDLMPGDMIRISSFGTVNGHPTLLDAGLTKAIFDEFYK
jgi:hypothetical protein